MRSSAVAVFACLSISIPHAVDGATPDPVSRLREAAAKSTELRVHAMNGETFVLAAIQNPDALRAFATSHYTFHRNSNPAIFESLKRALDDTRVVSASTPPDLRWGCEFYSDRGRLIGSFYLESIGIERRFYPGLFDGQRVVVNAALYRWFKHAFPKEPGYL